MKDLRDPRAVGGNLLQNAQLARQAYGPDIPLSEVWDEHVQHISFPNTPEVGPLERYGDPVAQHEAKIAAGEAVRLP